MLLGPAVSRLTWPNLQPSALCLLGDTAARHACTPRLRHARIFSSMSIDTSPDSSSAAGVVVLLLLLLQAASQSLAVVCDTIWPPNSGKDAWLRGTLAKWLLQAGFEGNNGLVLRQVRCLDNSRPPAAARACTQGYVTSALLLF